MLAIIQRDLILAYRSMGQAINPLIFFLITISLFPLAIGTNPETLYLIGTGVVWIAALLASLLTLDNLFRIDYEDGNLELTLLSTEWLPLLCLAKVFAHWMVTCLPLLFVTPLAAYLYGLDEQTIKILIISLLIGTPILSLIGSINMALTTRLGQSNLLLAILCMPFYVPVLIFSTMSINLYQNGLDGSPYLYLLLAMLIISIVLVPFATAAAIKVSME